VARAKSRMISLYIPVTLLNRLDDLVSRGYFNDRSEAIREAIRQLLKGYGLSGGDEEEG